jgi:hypothetical protein
MSFWFFKRSRRGWRRTFAWLPLGSAGRAFGWDRK